MAPATPSPSSSLPRVHFAAATSLSLPLPLRPRGPISVRTSINGGRVHARPGCHAARVVVVVTSTPTWPRNHFYFFSLRVALSFSFFFFFVLVSLFGVLVFFFFWFNSLSRGGLKARCFDEDFRGLLLGGSSYDTLFFFLNVSGQVLRVSFDVNVRSVDV